MTTAPHFFHLTRSSLRKRLLSYFFTNPEGRLYLREIARIIQADPANLSRELRCLEEEGLFTSAKRGNQKHFFLNQKYPLYSELKSMVFKTTGAQGAIEDILSKVPGIRRAFIYGSFAKNKERAGSDIDLCLVIRKERFREGALLSELRLLEKKLGREIAYVYFTEDELENKKKSKDSFILGLLKGKRIELCYEKDRSE